MIIASQVALSPIYQRGSMKLTQEEWRPVRGYEGTYEVSDQGNVRRIRPGCGAQPGRIKKSSIHKHSPGNTKYAVIHLYRFNRKKTTRVHQLVYDAFIGTVPTGCEINHKDGDKQNNRPSNLEAQTHAANVAHAIDTGLFDQRGEKNHQRVVSESDVARIIGLHRSGKLGYIKIGRLYGIAGNTVKDIVKGRTWGHVEAADIQGLVDVPTVPGKKRRGKSSIRSTHYRRWIRSFTCLVCGSAPTEASHTGEHGLAVKSSDFSCLPLCHAHHRTGNEAYHRIGRRAFIDLYNLDIPALIAKFNALWEAKQRRSA